MSADMQADEHADTPEEKAVKEAEAATVAAETAKSAAKTMTAVDKILEAAPVVEKEKTKPETELKDEAEKPAGEAEAQIPADLVEQAKALGFTDEDVKGLDESGLRVGISWATRNLLIPLPAKEQGREPATAVEAEAEAEAEPAAAPPPRQAAPQGALNKLRAEYGDALVVPLAEAIREESAALNKQLTQRLARLEKAGELTTRAEQERNWEALNDRFDAFVSSAGPEWKEVLGEGTRHTLDPKSPFFQSRSRVFNTFLTIAGNLQLRGMKVTKEAPLFKSALFAAFPEKVEAVARGKVKQELSARQKRFTGRPTNVKTGDPVDTMKETVKKVDAIIKDE